MAKTSIEWATDSWNPLRAVNAEVGGNQRPGWYCEKVSAGCKNCYASTLNRRLGTGAAYGADRGAWLTYLDEKALLAPLKARKPRTYFLCSMTDLFGAWVSGEMIDRIFAVMALCPQHTFICLTKRSKRMREYFEGDGRDRQEHVYNVAYGMSAVHGGDPSFHWPLPNVRLGVSVENQATANERIPDLLATPAACRWISLEPQLEAVNLRDYLPRNLYAWEMSAKAIESGADHERVGGLDWVVQGGESGPGARPMSLEWVYDTKRACQESNAALFVKQFGAHVNFMGEYEDGGIAPLTDNNFGGYRIHLTDRKGGDMSEWPEDLRVRMAPGDKWQ